MDKINQALSGVEDNAARILKLERKQKTTADKIADSDTKIDSLSDDVEGLLSAQAATASTVNKLDYSVSNLQTSYTTARNIITSQSKTLSEIKAQKNAFWINSFNSRGRGYFGKITGDVVLVFFNSVESLTVIVDNTKTYTGKSPICLMLTEENMQIETSPYVADARILVVGNNVNVT